MVQPLFVDTSALFALFVSDDERHEEARRIYSDVRAARRPLASSTDVFTELIALLSRRIDADSAARIGEELRREEEIRLVRVDDEIRDRGWAVFKARRFRGLSFADCTSSAILTMHRIREVFTFDDDFRRLGHRTLPGPRPLLKLRPASRTRRPVGRNVLRRKPV